jgi:putative membrane protein
MMNGMMNGMGMMVWGVVSFFSGLGLVVLFIVVAIAAVKWLWGNQRPFRIGGTEENVRDILKKRYARGEITKEEFKRLKKDFE